MESIREDYLCLKLKLDVMEKKLEIMENKLGKVDSIETLLRYYIVQTECKYNLTIIFMFSGLLTPSYQ